MREYLFNFRFDGKDWGTSLFANNEAEAREKIKAMALARYEGELMMRIPESIPGAGLFTRLTVWWKGRT